MEEQVGAASFSDAKLVQYYVLYSIFMATNGVRNPVIDSDPRFMGVTNIPGWLITTGWLENDLDPCMNNGAWFGIICQNDRVK